ncbi:hypothetical protein C808_00643 [Lachnospiraceae bacterium M18-1]|nr:hypothetical protein C808_00643 [Lachnospiraceae bacterium M18-1]
MERLKEKVKNIAMKYADLVEKRIDSAEELTGTDMSDIYNSIQMLGHITATLERFSRMENNG